MPVSGALAHIDVSVSSPARSIRFWAALLEPLGYRRVDVRMPAWQGPAPTRATWTLPASDGRAHFEIELRPSSGAGRERRYDRYEPGPHHLAFHAARAEVVERVHAAVRAIGGTVLDAPAEYGGRPGYGDAYYAAFFEDPDGLKLEVACIASANP